MIENKRDRDYSHEYTLRKKRSKRLYADIDRSKAEALQTLLKEKDIPFSHWLTEQIDKELEKP